MALLELTFRKLRALALAVAALLGAANASLVATCQEVAKEPNADAIDFVSFGYDASGMEEGVYYYASPDNATSRHLYYATFSGSNRRVEIESGSDEPADSASGFRPYAFETWSFSADGNWAIRRRSAFGAPTRIELVQLSSGVGKVVKTLQDNSE